MKTSALLTASKFTKPHGPLKCVEYLRPAGAYVGSSRCDCATCAVAWKFKQALRDTWRQIQYDAGDPDDLGTKADAVVNAPFHGPRELRVEWEALTVDEQLALAKAVLS